MSSISMKPDFASETTQEKAESLSHRSLFADRGKEKDVGITIKPKDYGKLLFFRLCIRGRQERTR